MKKVSILFVFLTLCQLSLQAQAEIAVKIVSPNSFSFQLSGKLVGPTPASALNIVFVNVPVNPSTTSSNFSFMGSSTIGSQPVNAIHVGYNNAPYAGSIQFRVASSATLGDTLQGCDTVVLNSNHGLTQSWFDGTYPIYWGRGTSATAGIFQSNVDSTASSFTLPQGNNQSFCNNAGHTLQDITISGSMGATYTWYDAATGGNMLPTNTVLQNGITYYVEENGSGCLSGRAGVTITLTTVALPTLPQGDTLNFCDGEIFTLQDIVVQGDSGATFTWYDAQTGGNVLSLSDTLMGGQNYFVSQTSQGCESNPTQLTVNSINLAVPTLPQGDTLIFCDGEIFTLQDIVVQGDSGASFTWYDAQTGGNNLSLGDTLQGGQSYFVSQSSMGCESDRALLDVTEISIDTATTQNGNTLTANGTGLMYQWIDCANGTPVPGETSQSFSPAQNGTYAVVLTDGNCTDTSGCRVVDGITGLDQLFSDQITLYPNPAADIITLETTQELEVKVVGLDSRLLRQMIALPGKNLLNLDGISPGIYLIDLSNKEGRTVYKLVKE